MAGINRLDTAKAGTLQAANEAKDANLITPELHARLTDGKISLQDWRDALNVRQANYSKLIDSIADGSDSAEQSGALAQKLFVAVNDQREAQGNIKTLLYTAVDALK